MEEKSSEHNFDLNGQLSHSHSENREFRIDNNPDKKNPWIVISIILGIAVIVLLVLVFRGGVTGGVIGVGSTMSGDNAGKKVVEYLNSKVGGGVEFASVEDLGELYKIDVKFQGQEIPVYSTKDGKYFVQGAIDMDSIQSEDVEETQPVEIPKSDKPKVELFVMTHCPYGTQAEKGIIPTLELLGDKVDSKIRFVHYFMHGDKEETETKNQICIREEQSDKYLDYLKCFLEAGDSEKCLTDAKIDKEKLEKCISEKADEYYKADSKLSENYGVQGSPTLVINGVIANSGRSSSAYLITICSAFNKSPEECNEKLETASPSPGFGYSMTGSNSATAQCD